MNVSKKEIRKIIREINDEQQKIDHRRILFYQVKGLFFDAFGESISPTEPDFRDRYIQIGKLKGMDICVDFESELPKE